MVFPAVAQRVCAAFIGVCVLASLGCHAPAAAHATAAGDAWPTPPGWRHETLTFPLDFAPTIPLRGEERIRFMPRFFEPAAPTYFSYVFVWIVDGPPDASLGADALGAELTTYFRGLCDAVGGKKYAFDPARFTVTLAPAAAEGEAHDRL